jgi:DNA-binding transcriptional ArsR family regulator
MKLTKKSMPERMYRAAELCRVLGSPTAYQVIKSLEQNPKTPTELSQELQVSLPTVSAVLRHLRQMDMVRCESKRRNRVYRLNGFEISEILCSVEDLSRDSDR